MCSVFILSPKITHVSRWGLHFSFRFSALAHKSLVCGHLYTFIGYFWAQAYTYLVYSNRFDQKQRTKSDEKKNPRIHYTIKSEHTLHNQEIANLTVTTTTKNKIQFARIVQPAFIWFYSEKKNNHMCMYSIAAHLEECVLTGDGWTFAIVHILMHMRRYKILWTVVPQCVCMPYG